MTDVGRPFSVKNLDHIVLRIQDLDVAMAFYTDVLGCSLERQLPEQGLFQLRAGDQLIDLVLVGSPLGGELPVDSKCRNMDHFCLFVEPFVSRNIYRWLDSHKLAYGKVVDRYGARGAGPSIYLHDPDGNMVELKGLES